MSRKERVRPSAKTSRTRVTEAVRLKPRPSVQDKMRQRQRRRAAIRSLAPRPRDVAAICAGAALGVAIALGGSL